MRKFLQDFTLISSTLILVTSVGLYLFNQNNKISSDSRATYVDEVGQLKYASGSCQKNADCFAAGCSNQVCSSNKNLITTCELRDDFPDQYVYACGCVNQKCAWYK